MKDLGHFSIYLKCLRLIRKKIDETQRRMVGRRCRAIEVKLKQTRKSEE